MLAGLFYLHASDPAPVWRPLAPPGAENLGLQAVPTSTGMRLWGIQDYGLLGQHLIYVDLPQTGCRGGSAYGATTGFSSVPTPAISIWTTSPAFR